MLLALLILGACACGHPQAVPSPTESAAPASEAEHKCVVIDAGHQRQGDPKQEPIGPGASETKPCVSDGTSGRFTGSPEYELKLAVALKLQELLEHSADPAPDRSALPLYLLFSNHQGQVRS